MIPQNSFEQRVNKFKFPDHSLDLAESGNMNLSFTDLQLEDEV